MKGEEMIQNEWALETLIKANEETGITFNINDGLN